METIDDKKLSTISGGNRVTLVEDLISRIGKLDLSKKQIGKLDKQVSKFEDKAANKGVVPRVADGDFGAPASSFIPITGD
jgi:bacteriocin-like protein